MGMGRSFPRNRKSKCFSRSTKKFQVLWNVHLEVLSRIVTTVGATFRSHMEGRTTFVCVSVLLLNCNPKVYIYYAIMQTHSSSKGTRRGHIFALECRKCVCGRGSAPDPAGGAYSAPPDPLDCKRLRPFGPRKILQLFPKYSYFLTRILLTRFWGRQV